MICFDWKTMRILLYIKRSGERGVTWGKLIQKYGGCANHLLLENFSREFYTVTQDENKNWVDFQKWDGSSNDRFRSFCTPKGNELIEKSVFDFWKWTIPTFISVIALVVSALKP